MVGDTVAVLSGSDDDDDEDEDAAAEVWKDGRWESWRLTGMTRRKNARAVFVTLMQCKKLLQLHNTWI